ncbi:MAG TPA: hypothetical protein VFR32_09900 [Gaiellaceae bacterium]|nr:hypothetical protein [Gaiellaceae bacterium]
MFRQALLTGRLDARGDLTTMLAGIGLTAVAVLGASRYGTAFGLGVTLALVLFVAMTVCFLAAPHVAFAVAIPLFAFIPALKIFAGYWVGPVKDGVTLAAALATALHVLQRDGRRTLERTDGLVLGAVSVLVLLYVLNLGGLSTDSWHGDEWLHGVRLTVEPLLLLLAGLLLPQPRRTMKWVAASLVVTGCIVAAYGLFQQVVGDHWLADHGYSYEQQLRRIGRQLRSFGTLDDSFAYAAFLFLALVAVVFWMRRSWLSWACAILIAVGITASIVRTAAAVASALLALWLVRAGQMAAGVILMAATLAMGLALGLTAAPATATEAKTVRAGPSTYLTLNGRTSAWATIFEDESKIPLGQGVGAVGTASLRAKIGITEVSGSPGHSKEGSKAVDSGYLAVVADVGIAGLVFLLLLFVRMAALAQRAARAPGGGTAGWLCLGCLTVLLLDALTRDSFTGFPIAYIGFLLVGVTLAVARDEAHERLATAR